MPSDFHAYKVSPNFYSMTSIAYVIGLCGGVVSGIFAAIGIFIDSEYENPWLWSMVALIATPLIQAFSFAFTAAIGYPIFIYWRGKSNGIHIEGTFSESDENRL